jgi:hypothetical protein
LMDQACTAAMLVAVGLALTATSAIRLVAEDPTAVHTKIDP